MRIIHVVGARPNFVKAAPLFAAIQAYPKVQQYMVHTGQHYDPNMSQIFFRQLDIPEPDANLNVGSGSHATQTAQIMLKLEPLLLDRAPDLVLVYGDVNSTVAAALVCAKLQFPLAHVEAGLRSFDREMPEEVNRLITDQLSDLLFIHSPEAEVNLRREGIGADKIHFVGNVMIDSLVNILPRAEKRWQILKREVGLDHYFLVTVHRPSNVEAPEFLKRLLETLASASRLLPVVFPLHPRTKKRIEEFKFWDIASGIQLIDALGYLDFIAMEANAEAVITDSGGIQEETTYLGVPCITIRKNTERPITVELGTNSLIGRNCDRLLKELRLIVDGKGKKGSVPALWDGNAAKRIARTILG